MDGIRVNAGLSAGVGVLFFVVADPEYTQAWVSGFQLLSRVVGGVVLAASASVVLGIRWGRRALGASLALATATFASWIVVLAVLFTTTPSAGTDTVLAIGVCANALGAVLSNGLRAYFLSRRVREAYGS